MNVEIPSNAKACTIDQYFYCLLMEFGQSPQTAKAITLQVAKAYGLEPAGKCIPGTVATACGYLTLPGALAVIASLQATGKVPNLNPSGPGSGLGNHYITPGFAGQIQTLNNNINDGIDATAQKTGVPLVDIRSIFQGVASGDPSNQYFKLAQVNPGVCCYLVFLGGLVSFDGLHPSNTGYALISHYFIQTINQRYHTDIPQVPIKSIYAGKPPYLFPDPYANQ
jgi:hypothetical protein